MFNFQPLSDRLISGKNECLSQLDKTGAGEFVMLESEDRIKSKIRQLHNSDY